MTFGFWEQGNPKTAGRGAVLMGYRTNFNGATSPAGFRAQPAERRKACRSWSLLLALPVRSSRAYCWSWPDEVARLLRSFPAIPGGSRRFCRRSEREKRDRRACEPFEPREARSAEVLPDWHLSRPGRRPGRRSVKGERLFFNRSPSRAAPAARVRAASAIELGAPAGCFDGLVRFDDFGMQCNGGACRTGNHRNGTEWRGGKLMSPSRAQAEPCRGLAQGTQSKCRLGEAWGILFGAAHEASALPHPGPLPPIGWAGEGMDSAVADRRYSSNGPTSPLHLPAFSRGERASSH